jgi:hypothetical protein
MIFVIGVIHYIVGALVFRYYNLPFERETVGALIGAALMLAGVAMALASCLMLAWRYLP